MVITVVDNRARLIDRRPSRPRIKMDELQAMVQKVLLDGLLRTLPSSGPMNYGASNPFIRIFDRNSAHLDRPFSSSFQVSLEKFDPNHELLPGPVSSSCTLRYLLAVWARKVRSLDLGSSMVSRGQVKSSDDLELVYHTPTKDTNTTSPQTVPTVRDSVPPFGTHGTASVSDTIDCGPLWVCRSY